MPVLNLDPFPEYKARKGTYRTVFLAPIPPTQVKSTLFYSLFQNTGSVPLNEQELAQHFATGAKPVAVEKPKDVEPAIVEETLTIISDKKRLNAISIAVATFKQPLDEIKQCILNGDGLSQESIHKLFVIINNTVATDFELAREFKANNMPLERFGKADQFCIVMSDVPFLLERIRAWDFIYKFDDLKPRVVPFVDMLFCACEQIKTNPMLHKVLTVTLALVNYLNTGKNKLYGFKLEGLTKLKDTKSSDGSSTLLGYLVKYFYELDAKHPEFKNIHQFYKDLLGIETAASVDMKQIAAELNEMEAGMTQTKQLVENLEKHDSTSAFLSMMKQVFSNNFELVQQTRMRFAECTDKCRECAQLFAENEDKIAASPKELFGPIATFVQEYKAEELLYLQNKQEKVNTTSTATTTTTTTTIPSNSNNRQPFDHVRTVHDMIVESMHARKAQLDASEHEDVSMVHTSVWE